MAKIVIVEDDAPLREILERELKAKGHTVLSAFNGREGLNTITREAPDLVVADVIMPELSGFEMVEQLRAIPERKNTKVIMITALNEPEDRAQGQALSVDAYIAKRSGTPADYVKTIEAVLSGQVQSQPSPPSTQRVDTEESPL